MSQRELPGVLLLADLLGELSDLQHTQLSERIVWLERDLPERHLWDMSEWVVWAARTVRGGPVLGGSMFRRPMLEWSLPERPVRERDLPRRTLRNVSQW